MINGQDAPVYYTFSVNGSVEKLIRNGATTNVLDTMVTGWTTNESDLFIFEEMSTSVGTSNTGGPAEVSVDGEAVDLDGFKEMVITLASRGNRHSHCLN